VQIIASPPSPTRGAQLGDITSGSSSGYGAHPSPRQPVVIRKYKPNMAKAKKKVVKKSAAKKKKK
jgi:hypothetical protein